MPDLCRCSVWLVSAWLLQALPLQAQGLPRILPNDNTQPAGRLAAGTTRLELRVVRGMFHPDGVSNPGEPLLAFAAAGQAPTIPGPLLRVREGTLVEVSVHNTLPDSTLVVYGLTDTPLTDSLVVRPGETGQARFTPKRRGTYFYYASTTHRRVERRFLDDSQLTGALIVDPATGAVPRDRIFVIGQWTDSAKADGGPVLSREVLMINGLSWPHTERLRAEVGEPSHWRFINATFDAHPMHLHGFYYRVTARGNIAADTVYASAQYRRVVTERLGPGTTMSMTWSPEKPGNWVMHCHLTFHILPHRPLGGAKQPPTHDDQKHGHAIHGMSGLVLGIEVPVRGALPKATVARRTLRLLVQEGEPAAGEEARRFAFVLHEPGTPEPAPDSLPAPGSPIIVERDQPIMIQVVNRTSHPTSIHWHGIELESFYDGVAGFGGYPQQITPSVAPHDSFAVYMTPPRAGTFMYHTHVNEDKQQVGGLYGAFVVLPPGERWDPARERVVMLATARRADAGGPLVNGKEQPDGFQLVAGETYRLRLINITMAAPSVIFHLKRGDQHLEWNAVAEDGADLEPQLAGLRKAQQQVSIGKTYDFLVTVKEPGPLRLELGRPNGAILRTLPIIVQ